MGWRLDTRWLLGRRGRRLFEPLDKIQVVRLLHIRVEVRASVSGHGDVGDPSDSGYISRHQFLDENLPARCDIGTVDSRRQFASMIDIQRAAISSPSNWDVAAGQAWYRPRWS